jgi:hypothetical protein
MNLSSIAKGHNGIRQVSYLPQNDKKSDFYLTTPIWLDTFLICIENLILESRLPF